MSDKYELQPRTLIICLLILTDEHFVQEDPDRPPVTLPAIVTIPALRFEDLRGDVVWCPHGCVWPYHTVLETGGWIYYTRARNVTTVHVTCLRANMLQCAVTCNMYMLHVTVHCPHNMLNTADFSYTIVPLSNRGIDSAKLFCLYYITQQIWWKGLSHAFMVQWNLSWETNVMKDHLSWKTRYFEQKVLYCNVIDPATETTCL